jgi:hypothetical protein
MTGAIDGRMLRWLTVLKPSVDRMSASLAWSTWSPLAKLAFTGKRPGKTQQFNFFAVNDKPTEKEVRYGDYVPARKI